MKIKKLITLTLLLYIFSVNMAFAVYSCGGLKDNYNCGVSNPFPCSSGNCTWRAWDKVCREWGSEAAKEIALNWTTPRHAKYWANKAESSSIFTVHSTPAIDTIGVKSGTIDVQIIIFTT